MTIEAYVKGHGFATAEWYPLKRQIDSYPLSSGMKNDLNQLFELAEKYVYLAYSDQPFRSSNMMEKWKEMQQIARKIYSSAQSSGFLK